MVRYGLGTPEIYASTGVIGAVCVALFLVGIVSVRAKTAKALVLVRNVEGRVVSIKEAEYGHVARGKTKAAIPRAKPIQASQARHMFSSWKVKIVKRAINAKRMLILALMRCLMAEVKTRKFELVSLKKRQISEIKVYELNTCQARKHGEAKHVVGVAVLAALVLGSYASMMAAMGYTVQDAVSGMYSPFMAVPSGSMQPALNYGDLIIVRREAAEGIVVGDVIVFNVPSPYDRLASSPTIHRVVEELVVDGETLFKTKGDSNPSEDPWSVSAENVIGEYAGKVPYLGLAVLFLRGPIGLASIAALIALSFLYPYIKKKRGGGATP